MIVELSPADSGGSSPRLIMLSPDCSRIVGDLCQRDGSAPSLEVSTRFLIASELLRSAVGNRTVTS